MAESTERTVTIELRAIVTRVFSKLGKIHHRRLQGLKKIIGSSNLGLFGGMTVKGKLCLGRL
jgi:hypothetical protein